MDQKTYEVEQTTSVLPGDHKSCSESHTPIRKPQTHEISHDDANLVSPTPQKTEASLNIKCKKEPDELPEKYRLLYEFFNRMITSLRLLNLRKQLPTFQNISRLVETLTGRKFSYKTLAQIKFILSEAVQIDKILLHNKKTLCMEPDIKVTLLFDVIDDGQTKDSYYMDLSRLLFSRLFKFANAHSEDDDVPEAELPEPFNRKQITVSTNVLPVNRPAQTTQNLDVIELLNPSHLPPSFKRHFSAKETQKPSITELSQFLSLPSSSKEIDFSPSLEPVKEEKTFEVVNGDTPMKKPLVVNGINIVTPDLSTPKRSMATEDDKPKSPVNEKVTASGLVVKRSLDFSTFDEESRSLEGNTT